MYRIYHAYFNEINLDTHDLLEAVKVAFNLEADLYSGYTLIVSPLGLTRKENNDILLSHGVNAYPDNEGWYKYKYCA